MLTIKHDSIVNKTDFCDQNFLFIFSLQPFPLPLSTINDEFIALCIFAKRYIFWLIFFHFSPRIAI